MRLLLASEARFCCAAGRVWTTGPEDYGFWSFYAESFEKVGVLARVREAAPPAGARPADGPGVVFHALDDYRGPVQYLWRLPALRTQAARVVHEYDKYLLRAPGAVAYLAASAISGPYGVEVLGDPWESLAGFHHPLEPVARLWSRSELRRLARDAAAVCYVALYLRSRYPAKRAFVCSDVRLAATVEERGLRERQARADHAVLGRRPWRLGFAGTLERLYKAPDVLLEAVALCRRAGVKVEVWLAGEGRYRSWLERRAGRLGLNGAARFTGSLPPGAAMEQFFDGLDLFVLPSRTEGLPRALVEAMGRGCPAIGSTAGGIPELLEREALVQPGAAAPLAERILACLADPSKLERMARRNLTVTQQYLWERLAPRRREFLWELRNSSST
jgi:glycosyltransferase involved in cell wall biosynthesis